MDPLLERETELATLDASLEAARAGRGGVVVVEGAPGAGKTMLLRAFRELVSGVRVLQGTGGELEREFPFGVVRQLFERAVLAAPPEQRDRWLSGAAALAAPVVGAAPDQAEPIFDASFATLHGLYWLAATMADEAPLLLVVDDAHWADEPSLRFLDFLGRRAGELPLLVLVGTRPGELPDAILADATVVSPRPLTREGVQALLGGDEAAVNSALDVTRGNPLLLRELVRELGDEPVTADAIRSAVPSSLTRSVERRLARVPESARTVARALAVLGRAPGTLAAVTGLAREEVIDALAVLRAIDLVEDDRFTHPLLRAAAAESVSAAERDALHHRAARHLKDPEEVVVHLLAARPLGEPWAAEALRGAARRALAEGVPDAALRRLRRALEEVEPTPEERFGYELELGRAAVRAGDPTASEHLLAAAQAPDAALAAQAVVELVAGGQFTEGIATGVARMFEARERLGPEDKPLRDILDGQIMNAVIHDHELGARRKEILTGLATDPGPGLNAHLAYDAASGEATAAEALEFARRAFADRPFTRIATLEHPTAFWAIVALIAVDGAELGRAAIAEAEETVQRHRTRLGSTFVAFMRAEWTVAFGSAALAEADAREALELWGAMPQNAVAIGARSTLVRALVGRGDLEAAEREAAGFPPDAFTATLWSAILALTARHELLSALGRYDEAIEAYERMMGNLRVLGWQRMTEGYQTARHARNLIALGRVDEGRKIAELERANAVLRGVASFELAALLALEEYEAAAAIETPSVHLRAEAQFELGAALRRAGKRVDARAPLALARDLATRIDATGLATRAAEELVIAGGRPRRVAQEGVAALTPSERRTAEHAARGLSNREIAETLYVTRKTVEFTLGNVYSKLGIRSRAELPAALGAQ